MFSVVVPTFNRADGLRLTLDSLLAQRVDFPYEILVVDNNSMDNTRAAVREFQQHYPGKVRYLFEGQQGSSAARNAGIQAAQGEIIAFVDDDVVADPGWLAALRDAYVKLPDAWSIGGKVALTIPGALPDWFDPHSTMLLFYLSFQDFGSDIVKIDSPLALSTANFSVRREAFARVGLFDTALGRFDKGLLCGEDTNLCHRIQKANGAVYFCGEAIVSHIVPTSRITKRFFRERAYWQGITEGLFEQMRNRKPSWSNLAREGVTLLKDSTIAGVQSILFRSREAFRYEAAVRKRVGYLHQILFEKQRVLAPQPEGNGAAEWWSPVVTIIRTPQDLEAIGKHWTDLSERAGTSVFQTFEWQSAWWKHFSGGRRLHAIAVWHGKLVGIAPFVVETVSARSLNLFRRVRFLGCETSDYLDLIIDPDHSRRVAQVLAEYLLSHRKDWDVLELEDVPDSSPSTAAFLQALEEKGCRITPFLHHRCCTVPLPDNSDEYLTRLSSGTRRNLLRENRKLGNEGFHLEVIGNGDGSLLGESLDDFFQLHERRWLARGSHGSLSAPNVRAFHRDVAAAFHRRGWLRLSFLKRDGQRIAGELGYVYDNRAYSYLLGLDPTSPWTRYSPGTVLCLQTIQRSIGDGLKEYDFLRGIEQYKISLRAQERVNWRYEVVPPRLPAALRVRMRKTLLRSRYLARRARAVARTTIWKNRRQNPA